MIKKDTYRPLDVSGNDYAGMTGMTELDRAALEAAQRSWTEADAAGDQAAKDAAHRQAETIRGRYSYSGGADGSQYLPKEQFSYKSAPQYVNRYQGAIDDLTKQILGRGAFSYDPETDPSYQQYRESYTRNGQRAMQDTLGQVSARTGGLASSYATSAAQQTYDNYMSALADKVPELRQLAYAMYQDEGDRQRADLEMLTALEQGDYGKYADRLGQYNTDRNFGYGVYRDALGMDQDKAQTLAAAGDFSGYKALGYSDAEINTLRSAYEAASTRSGGRGGGGGEDKGNVYQRMYDAGIRNRVDAYAWLMENGYKSNDQLEQLQEYYMNWLSGKDYEKNGVPTDPLDLLNWKVDHGLMTEEAAIEEAKRLNGEGGLGKASNNGSSAYNEYLMQEERRRQGAAYGI